MKNKILNWINKDKKIIIASLITGFVLTTGISFYTMNYSNQVQKNIADSVIRLHVLANSNTDADQNLKLTVRDEILNKYSEKLINSKTINQSRKIIEENLKNIEKDAEEVIKENGYDYIVTASLENAVFPTKYYGDVSFPPGEYEALRIQIGEAEGENWWCVMFPPLCFIDVTTQEDTEQIAIEQLEEDLLIVQSEIKYQKEKAEITKTKRIRHDKSNVTESNIAYISKMNDEFENTGSDFNIDVLENNLLDTEKNNHTNIEIIEVSDIDDIEEEIIAEEKEDNLEIYIVKDIEIDEIEKSIDKEIKDTEDIMEKYADTENQDKKGKLTDESRKILEDTLGEEELELLTKTDETEIKVKFKIVEFWQNIKNKNKKPIYTKK